MKKYGQLNKSKENTLTPNWDFNISGIPSYFILVTAFTITEVPERCDLPKPLFPSVVVMMKMLHHYQQNLLISTH